MNIVNEGVNHIKFGLGVITEEKERADTALEEKKKKLELVKKKPIVKSPKKKS